MQETGSDASTADTSPYVSDEMFYADMRNAELPDMAWPGNYPPITSDLPFPSFATLHRCERQLQPWQQTGWQGVPSMVMPEVLTAGSAKHKLGQCKPCAFFWKDEGCEN